MHVGPHEEPALGVCVQCPVAIMWWLGKPGCVFSIWLQTNRCEVKHHKTTTYDPFKTFFYRYFLLIIIYSTGFLFFTPIPHVGPPLIRSVQPRTASELAFLPLSTEG